MNFISWIVCEVSRYCTEPAQVTASKRDDLNKLSAVIQKNCQMVTYKPFMEPSWNLTKWLFSNYRAVKIRRLKIAITLLTGFVKKGPPVDCVLRRWTLWSYRFLINAFNRSEVIKSFISGERYTVWSSKMLNVPGIFIEISV